MSSTILPGVMQTIAADVAGTRLAETFAEDQHIHEVLLLHDLHPADLPSRVDRAVNRLLPHLAVQGVIVQGVEVDGERVRVRLALGHAGHYQGGDAGLIRQQIEQALNAAAPDAEAIDIHGLPASIAPIAAAHIPVRRHG